MLAKVPGIVRDFNSVFIFGNIYIYKFKHTMYDKQYIYTRTQTRIYLGYFQEIKEIKAKNTKKLKYAYIFFIGF